MGGNYNIFVKRPSSSGYARSGEAMTSGKATLCLAMRDPAKRNKTQ